MTTMHGSKARVYAGAYDLSGFLSSFSASASADTAEVTTFGAVAKTYIAGVRDGTLSGEGYWDGDPNAVDAVLSAALGTVTIVSYWPQGDSFGASGRAAETTGPTSYEVSSPVDGAATISLELQSSGGLHYVRSLLPKTTVSGNGNGSALDNTAATSNGGVGYLHVFGVSSGSLAVKIQDSADNSVWADIITFTAATTGGAQRVAITGTVRRYVRALWTITGGATLAVGFARL
jgi:hypothetical protein